MAVERREKDVGGGGRGGKDRNLNLVDVYDIAADIGKVRDQIMGIVLVRMRIFPVWSMFTTLLSILGR